MFRLTTSFLVLFAFLSSCMKGQQADLIIHNAVIHSMDEKLTTYEAMAIKDGVIIELGPERQILNKYSADETIDAKGRDVYPGFTDAHTHILLAAKQRIGADLSEVKSYSQLITELEIYQQRNNKKIIVGQGWNEGLWRDQTIPDNKKLNTYFPSTPVCLFRYDGHTALVNEAMLELAGINNETVVEGGEIKKENGILTGILTDNAMELVKNKLPKHSKKELKEQIAEIQNELFMYGITNVHDAGLDAEDVEFYKKLIDEDNFKINMYGMLLPTKENIQFARKNGIFDYKNLSIRSFKVFADGALGSRGAFLKEPYTDNTHSHGHATVNKDELDSLVKLCLDLDYQLNTHAIGDASIKMILDAYKDVKELNSDHRWRIEHAQIIDPADLPLFAKYGVFPSIQPTHAVSDYLFAENRIGKDRLKSAYAYQSLLNTTGMLAIGTDYPIEGMDPFRTIYAACTRKNDKEIPSGGFIPEEAISLDDCLKGMTIWAALAGFQEDRIGRLEVGMDATFAIFEKKITVQSTFQNNFSLNTFIKGILVYSV
jgi:predicted amidohydrolase YtcJ